MGENIDQSAIPKRERSGLNVSAPVPTQPDQLQGPSSSTSYNKLSSGGGDGGDGRPSWVGLQQVLEHRELYGTVRAKGFNHAFQSYDIFAHNRNRQTLWQRDLKGHTGCVNAVEFSPTEEFIVSGGDDCNVQVWRTLDAFVGDEPRPFITMSNRHFSNIFALRFSLHTERVYSGANDHQLIVHDIATRGKLRVYGTVGAYYRIATHPTNDHVIAAASENSRLHIYDLREKSPNGNMIGRANTFYSVEYNPQNSYLLAACGYPSGLCIYDMRNPDECYARADKKLTKEAICADFSPDGKAIFCVVQRREPLYFDLELSTCVEMKDPSYANLSTIKSCTFAGSDYVLSGSDEWNIYAWKAPRTDDIEAWGNLKVDRAYTVLQGHRSVVNHVRYSRKNSILLSCGVEKIVKCWSHVEMRNAYRDPPRRERNPRVHGFRFRLLAGGDGDDGDGDDDSMEEDLGTLYQFDFYHVSHSPTMPSRRTRLFQQQALAQREGRDDRRQRLLNLIRAYDAGDDDEGGDNDGEENDPLFPRVVVFPNENEDDSDESGEERGAGEIRVGDDVMMFDSDDESDDDSSNSSPSSSSSSSDSSPTASMRSHSSSRLGGGGGSVTMAVDEGEESSKTNAGPNDNNDADEGGEVEGDRASARGQQKPSGDDVGSDEAVAGREPSTQADPDKKSTG